MISLTSHIDNETIVTVGAEPGTSLEGFVGNGLARCRPDDVYSPEIGERIALGRAIIDFGVAVLNDGLARTVSIEEFERVMGILPEEALLAMDAVLNPPRPSGLEAFLAALGDGPIIGQEVLIEVTPDGVASLVEACERDCGE